MAAFRVLMVCTANHCRSPIAQQLLSQGAAARFGDDAWLVDSAGTDVRAPWPIHDHARAVLAERVPEVAPHHSTDLLPGAITSADLVLTASRHHRSSVVSMVPAAIGRTFTILQFARLCTQVAPIVSADAGELGRQLVINAKLARSSLQPVPVEFDDLADPMGRGIDEFRICADQVQVAIDSILRPLEFERPPAPVSGGAAGPARPVPTSPRRLGRHRPPR